MYCIFVRSRGMYVVQRGIGAQNEVCLFTTVKISVVLLNCEMAEADTSPVTVKVEKEDYDEDAPIVDLEAMVKVEMTEDVVVNDVNARIFTSDNEYRDEEANLHTFHPLVNIDKTIFPSKEKRLAAVTTRNLNSQYKHSTKRLDCLDVKELKKKRKVESERERRRELTELYDELHFQVKMNEEGLPRYINL